MVGGIGGPILALVMAFKPTISPRIRRSLTRGSRVWRSRDSRLLFEVRSHGIAIQAVGLTFAVLAVMLVAYRFRIIRATERFRAIVVGATGAIALFYLVSMVLSLFHVGVPILNSSSPLGIGLSLVIVGVAALNLILDFDFIESGASYGAPRYMEWYGAFALLVTLVWLYLEILRLLANSRRND